MKFNDLYLDYKDEELEIRMALKTVINDEKVVAAAAKQYQMGKAQDLVYAEQQVSKGAVFNTVDKTINANIKRRAKARPEFDDRLRKALIKTGKLPDLIHDYQAHHIVAKDSKRAARALAILRALGIDVDDPCNGVFLPANEKAKQSGPLRSAYVHNKVHTKPCFANVTHEVIEMFNENAHKSKSEQKQQMIDLLSRIGDQLRRGDYPLYQFIPGAEIYTV